MADRSIHKTGFPYPVHIFIIIVTLDQHSSLWSWSSILNHLCGGTGLISLGKPKPVFIRDWNVWIQITWEKVSQPLHKVQLYLARAEMSPKLLTLLDKSTLYLVMIASVWLACVSAEMNLHGQQRCASKLELIHRQVVVVELPWLYSSSYSWPPPPSSSSDR